MPVSKRIAAFAAILALALPVAPAGVAYDEICVANRGAFSAYFQIKVRARGSAQIKNPELRNYVAHVDFSDKDDRAPFSHEYISFNHHSNSWHTFPAGKTHCISGDYFREHYDILPGDVFAIRSNALVGKAVDCHQANNERRWDDSGRPWHRVFNWPGRGGRLDLTTWGTTLNLHCDIRGGEYMWEGCEHGREGFRKSACYPWRPQITGSSAYDLTADRGKSVAYLASVARRGANLDARVNNEYPLHVAVRLDRLDHTKVLLGQGPYLNGGDALDSDRNRARLNWQNGNGESPLYLAAQLGRVAHARALLANRADANLANAQGNAPLHAAALASAPNLGEMAALLVGGGADINAPGGDGRSPLMIAVENGAAPGDLRRMVAAGADPEQFDRHRSFSPMHRAVSHSVAALEALLSRGANINAQDGAGLTPLLWASDMRAPAPAGGSREQMALAMLRMGADPAIVGTGGDKRHPLLVMTESGMSTGGLRAVVAAGGLADVAGNNGYTPLHAAVKLSPEAVRAVLSGGGANADVKDRNGFTPLMWAATTAWRERAKWGDDTQLAFAEIVDALIAAGADPATENNDGENAFSLAETHEKPRYMREKLSEVLNASRPPDSLREDGQTLLQGALAAGDEGEARRLLDSGADPNLAPGNADDNGGRRPLMIAVEERRSPAIIRALVQAGANPALHDAHRRFSALHTGAKRSAAVVAALMTNAEANIDAPDGNGFTPLMWAMDPNAQMEEGSVADVIDALLQRGANPLTENKNGDTALSLAERNGMPDAILEKLRAAETAETEN